MFCVISTRLVTFVTRCKRKCRTSKLYPTDEINPQLDFRTQQRSGGLWGARGGYHTLLRAGPRRGMMGSNNHIITSGVWAAVRRQRDKGSMQSSHAGRQAASLSEPVTLIHAHVQREKSPPCETQSHLLLWDARQHPRSRIQKAGYCSRRKGRGSTVLGIRIRGHWVHQGGPDLHQRARSELKPQCWLAGGGGANTLDNHCQIKRPICKGGSPPLLTFQTHPQI